MVLIFQIMLIATDGSQYESISAVGIGSYDLDYSFSFRLDDPTPILEAELLARALAIRIPSSVSHVIFVTDSLSLCILFVRSENSVPLKIFPHFFQITLYQYVLCGCLDIQLLAH